MKLLEDYEGEVEEKEIKIDELQKEIENYKDKYIQLNLVLVQKKEI